MPNIDLDKYRLRRFVRRLIDMGEVEIHDEPVPLTGLSAIIESTDKALLFTKAGPERLEIAAKTAGNRRRLAAAFETTKEDLYDEYFRRLGNLQPLVEVPSDEAPVHAIKITGEEVDLSSEQEGENKWLIDEGVLMPLEESKSSKTKKEES